MDKTDNKVRSTVSKRLSILRKSNKLTQKEVAEQLNKKFNLEIRQATISSYEQGVTLPPLEMAVIFSKFYDTSIDWICGITKDSEIDSEFLRINEVTKTIYNLCVQLPFVDIKKSPNDKRLENYKELAPDNECELMIDFRGELMQEFLSEFKKMLDLYNSDVIDGDVLNLWYEKAENKYKCSVEEWDEPVIPF